MEAVSDDETGERDTPAPDRDDLSRGMDNRQAECALKLMSEYGHPWGRAHHLAMDMRFMLEADLRKPVPLICLTGGLMGSHEVVIRLGRPFDMQTDRGVFLTGVREITVPFADRESAEAALREIAVSVRPVHDAGGEDYRSMVVGEVVRPELTGG